MPVVPALPASTASITITTNTAPRNGILTLTPKRGSALITAFQLRTDGYTDTASDYPLHYSFAYTTYLVPDGGEGGEGGEGAYTVPTGGHEKWVWVKKADAVPIIDTVLAEGLDSNDYRVIVMVVASDVHGAKSTTTQPSIVLPGPLLFNLASIAADALTAAAKKQDTIGMQAVIGAAVSSLNRVNCSAALHCPALNRLPCADVSNTCGPCKHAYTGQFSDVPANEPCYLDIYPNPQVRAIGESCGDGLGGLGGVGGVGASTSPSPVLCLSGNCVNGICATARAMVCSGGCGRGECVFRDLLNNPVAVCLEGNISCRAMCDCTATSTITSVNSSSITIGDSSDTGVIAQVMYGHDCSLSYSRFEQLLQVREVLCASLLEALEIQTVGTIADSEVIWSTTLLASKLLLHKSELSSTALHSCAEATITAITSNPAAMCDSSSSSPSDNFHMKSATEALSLLVMPPLPTEPALASGQLNRAVQAGKYFRRVLIFSTLL